MLTPATKDWISVLAPIASLLLAGVAVVISIWVFDAQRRLQERQLKQDLFDKRYSVYLSVLEMLKLVMRHHGAIDITGGDFEKFSYAVNRSEFLFDADVAGFISEISVAVLKLNDLSLERKARSDLLEPPLPELDNKFNEDFAIFVSKVIGGHKEVFRGSLSIGQSQTLGVRTSSAQFTGWKRLCVVVAAVWLLPVLAFTYAAWPTSADISNRDIYTQMGPDDGQRLADYYDVLAGKIGETTVPSADAVSLGGTVFDELAGDGQVADIAGHFVRFSTGVSREDMDRTAKAYTMSLRHILRVKRAAIAGETAGLWAVPLVILYALGWAVAWVKRGFIVAT